jgi:hypothetical protein
MLKKKGVDWVGLGLGRRKWQTVVNTVMNSWVPQYAGFDQLRNC